VRPAGFVVVPVGPVISDLRVREDHDLAGIGRVRENFLISGERGIEYHFSGPFGGRAKAPAFEERAVFQGQECRVQFRLFLLGVDNLHSIRGGWRVSAFSQGASAPPRSGGRQASPSVTRLAIGGTGAPLGGAFRLPGLPGHPVRRRDSSSVRGLRREGPARGRGLQAEMGSFRQGYKWVQFVRVGARKWVRLVFLPARPSAYRTPRPRGGSVVPSGPDSASTGTNCWTCWPSGGSLRPAGSCGSARA